MERNLSKFLIFSSALFPQNPYRSGFRLRSKYLLLHVCIWFLVIFLLVETVLERYDRRIFGGLWRPDPRNFQRGNMTNWFNNKPRTPRRHKVSPLWSTTTTAVQKILENSVFFFNIFLKIQAVIRYRALQRNLEFLLRASNPEAKKRWSRNELYFLVLMLAAMLVKQARTIFYLYWVTQLAGFGFGRMLLIFIYRQIKLWYIGDYQIEVLQYSLLKFIYLVADNISYESSKGTTGKKLESQALEAEVKSMVRKYLKWLQLWKMNMRQLGVFLLLVFSNHLLTFCLALFYFMMALSEKSFFSLEVMGSLHQFLFAAFKIICLGNAAHDVKRVVRGFLNQLSLLNYQLTSKVPFESTNEALALRVKSFFYFVERRDHFTLDALKFFVVSRSTLTAVAGVIVTYEVVLLQFQSTDAEYVYF